MLFYTFSLRTYWAIGTWPQNKHDRLQARLDNGLHDVLVASGLIGRCLFLPWLLASAIALREKRVSRRLVCPLSLGWAAMAFVCLVDPMHLF